MEFIKLEEIIKAVNGELVITGEKDEYNSVSTDTRKIKKGDIFIALKGENFNGNNFVETAIEKGAALCIVSELKFDKEKVNKSSYIVKVKNTNKAILDLAKYYKSKLDIKVVAITGSTGKTSTKDLVAAVLSEKYKVFKTEGNFNNEIGLPLMIFKLDKSYDIAVLEMGMNHLNEIHNMAEAAKPDIAIITNIGISHIENLGSRENILKAKLEVTDFFGNDNVLIINGDNDILSNFESDKYKVYKIGTEDKFDFNGQNLILEEESIKFDILEQGKIAYKGFKVNVPGKHNVLNSLIAVACGKILDMDYKDIQNGIKKLEATSMRLDIIKENGFTIINDCYNASPDSMKAAIDVMKNINGKRTIAILGTMMELGNESYKAHREVSEYAKEKQVDLLFSIGEFNEAYREGFEETNKDNYRSFFNNKEAAIYIKNIIRDGDVILVKASRAMKLEEIVEELKIKQEK
ncbi:UDP-N-acetylmuramoyl-tripeptide--D-alanyl-D-alanine ligase [Clostridium tepidum]|jgi:UDP-N-acetylmuramoyl-tripeptide--D-alanyl-D-alanine ligase|uniref:UDP-N-acetylmuramoyl-tripeptide--D-alanyl-D-alanine ligase n=1 Tax=Clostridium tepidum TaxID=1962263 RepID=A0A1S9I913_9CLOT|nr:UDP-N-acetylmuramoyl-tripeptide--D-alanyl-D-alanine ligase [Clostridium tepidum]MCR1933232.1 UDP-N-acetylmuramoyl-tripeptide--D-alanyl-D-alanine ligase [Clostridium tepidum]MDU6877394.1 UDP-N-acetylmuramoyl-tripeptide--D-alanyl-D-alanine ligase [Clostridium botulinum]OOO62713.1 UDP-N-acetylmuramoyl-tripeptide--D-alanyl-D-alanine ligase [Clostridium tepidum]OOO66814.1 UDP-N-acetylmuramoyl-tripeptide--D-alanyl-D-alanine ligase [Clostridium tepidum]